MPIIQMSEGCSVRIRFPVRGATVRSTMPAGWFDRIWLQLRNRKLRLDSGEENPRSRFRGTAGWVAVALLAVLFASIASVPVMRHWRLRGDYDSIGDLRNLPQGSSVRLRGTVTYSDLEQLYIQDDTGAVRIALRDPKQTFAAGQVLAVRARITARYNRQLGPSSVKLVDGVAIPAGRDALPAAELRSFRTIPSRSASNTRTELQGIVREASLDQWHLSMTLAMDRHEVRVIVPRSEIKLDPSSLVDAQVTVTGVPEPGELDNSGRHQTRLYVTNSASLRVDAPAPAVVPLVSSLEGLTAFPGYQEGHRVRVRGTVVTQQSVGAGQTTVISGSSMLVRVLLARPQSFSRGTMIEAIGFPTPGSFRGDLINADLRPIPSAPGGAAEAATSAVNALPTLTTVAAIRALDNREADRAHPVRLHGVVTYADLDWHFFYLQDATGGIFVWAVETPVATGEEVELEGTTSSGNYAPNVTAPHIHVLGPGRMPAPLAIVAAQAASGLEDSKWVNIEGVVHSFSVQSVGTHGEIHGIMEVVTQLGKVRVWTFNLPQEYLEGLVDANVRLCGAFGTIYNRDDQLMGYALAVPRKEDITVLQPRPTGPGQSQPIPISYLLRYSPETDFSHRVRVQGVVTMNSLDRGIYLQDATGGLQVQTQSEDLQVGDLVEAEGYVISGGSYSPVMRDAEVRKLGSGTAPAPKPVNSGNMDTRLDNRLAQIDARLLRVVNSAHGKTLMLESGTQTFNAQIDDDYSLRSFEALRPGSLLRLTGLFQMVLEAKANAMRSSIPSATLRCLPAG